VEEIEEWRPEMAGTATAAALLELGHDGREKKKRAS